MFFAPSVMWITIRLMDRVPATARKFPLFAGSNREAVRSPVQGALAWSIDSRHLLGGPDELKASFGGFKAAQGQGFGPMEGLKQGAQGGIVTPPDPNIFKNVPEKLREQVRQEMEGLKTPPDPKTLENLPEEVREQQ